MIRGGTFGDDSGKDASGSSEPGIKGDDVEDGMYGPDRPETLRPIGCFEKLSDEGERGAKPGGDELRGIPEVIPGTGDEAESAYILAI